MSQSGNGEKNGSNGFHSENQGSAHELSADDDRMLTWLRIFNGYHRKRPGCLPVLFKSVVAPAPGSDGERAPLRFVWEVCKTYNRRGVTWSFMAWAIDARGVTFTDCATYAEALALYDRQPTAEYPPGSRGVFLRPDAPPPGAALPS